MEHYHTSEVKLDVDCQMELPFHYYPIASDDPLATQQDAMCLSELCEGCLFELVQACISSNKNKVLPVRHRELVQTTHVTRLCTCDFDVS